MRTLPSLLGFTLVVTLFGCGGDATDPSGDTTTTTSTSTASGGTGGAGGATATGGTGGETTSSTSSIDKAKDCTDTFGDALTNAFGRLDGTVLAVLKPTDQQCPLPNDDHVIIEVVSNGAAYRMVVNVLSLFNDPDVDYLAIDHALPGDAWQEGWHPGLKLDYATDFGVKADAFTPVPMNDLVEQVVGEIPLDEKISVYATSSGGSSAHKIHRNEGITDGAIVLHPGEPNARALLFHFSNQMF